MSMLESRTVQLKTISPVHIQGKDNNFGLGFVQRDKQTAYAIDSDRLGLYLLETTGDLTLVNKFIEEVEEKADKNKLKDLSIEVFLSNAGIYHHHNNRGREQELIKAGVFKTVVNAPMNNQFIQNRKNNAFIPGSSLKGVLRTAILYHQVKQQLLEPVHNSTKAFFNKLLSHVNVMMSNSDKYQREKAKRNFSRELQQCIFQNGKMGIHPDLDFLRCVKVSDSQGLNGLTFQYTGVLSLGNDKNISAALPVTVEKQNVGHLVKKGDGVDVQCGNDVFTFINKIYKKRMGELQSNIGREIEINEWGGDKVKEFAFLDSYVESEESSEVAVESCDEKVNYTISFKTDDSGTLQKTQVQTFQGDIGLDITLDHFLLDDFVKMKKYTVPFTNIDELLGIVNQFSRDLWHFEKSFFELCRQDQFDISGINDFYCQPMPNNLLRMGWGTGLMGMTLAMLLKPRDLSEFRNKLYINRGDMPAPKSRRVTLMDNEPQMPLGWLEYELL